MSVGCPVCHCNKSYVLHASNRNRFKKPGRVNVKHYGLYRRRQCADCGELFSTLEIHFHIFRSLTDCFKDMKRVLRLNDAMEYLAKSAAEVAEEEEEILKEWQETKKREQSEPNEPNEPNEPENTR